MAKIKTKKPEKKKKPNKERQESNKNKPQKKKTKSPLKKGKKPQTRNQKGGTSLKTQGKKPEVKDENPSSKKRPKWKDEIFAMLIQMRKELLRDVSRSFKTESDPLKFDVGDFYDHASSDRDRELALMFTDRERDKLVQIDEALKSIEEGSYGICESCGDEIDKDRLKAMPFAKL
jgi:DnaK suppressor protein